MPLLHFLVPRSDHLPAEAALQAYLAGRDGAPWTCYVAKAPDGLVIERAERDSGTLYIPWKADHHGELMLSTSTLMQRDKPYHLCLELARGTLHRFRSQLAAWQAAGLLPPKEVHEARRESTAAFARSATSQHDPQLTHDYAQKSLVHALDGVERLAVAFGIQASAVRRHQPQRAAPLLGFELGAQAIVEPHLRAYQQAFNTALIPFNWRSIESVEGKLDWSQADAHMQWCQSTGLRVGGGPVFSLEAPHLPDWLYMWDDFDSVVRLASGFVEEVVRRYRGQVRFWHCTSRINTGTALELSSEQRIQLAVRIMEAVRGTDQRTPIIVSVDQPWAEYTSRREMDITPHDFVETLVRAGLGVSGVGLETRLGNRPGDTLPRDAVGWNELIDRYGHFGLPLALLVTPADATARKSTGAWLARSLTFLTSKPAVQAVFWMNTSPAPKQASPPPEKSTVPKAALEAFHRVRASYAL